LLGQHVVEPLVGAQQADLGLAAGLHQGHGLLGDLMQGLAECALAVKGESRTRYHHGDQDGKPEIDPLQDGEVRHT
jgi:hypothetical protein